MAIVLPRLRCSGTPEMGKLATVQFNCPSCNSSYRLAYARAPRRRLKLSRSAPFVSSGNVGYPLTPFEPPDIGGRLRPRAGGPGMSQPSTAGVSLFSGLRRT
jgi:hypothetical protein